MKPSVEELAAAALVTFAAVTQPQEPWNRAGNRAGNVKRNDSPPREPGWVGRRGEDHGDDRQDDVPAAGATVPDFWEVVAGGMVATAPADLSLL